jgi:hypothetical protein
MLAADFCETIMGDDRVAAALNTRCKGLVSLPVEFEAARGGKRAVKALEAGEDWYVAYSESALSQLLAWGNLLGVGLGRNVWTDRGSTINRIIPILEVWHPRNLRFDWMTRTWRVRVNGGTEVEINPGDGTWVLYTPYGTNRPWAWGAWRAIALWYLLKLYAIQDWARYSEKNGQGLLVATAPEGVDKQKRKELAEDFKNLSRDTAVVLPAGFTLDLVEATANNWQTFEAQKNAADVGTAVAILGQNMSTEVSGPVGTGATLHGRVMQIYIDADAETLATCVHDQALVWWAEFNFGSRDLAPWPCYDTDPPEDKKAKADLGKVLSGIGAFTVNEVREACGYEELAEGGDELLKPSSPFAGPPGGGGNAPPPPPNDKAAPEDPEADDPAQAEKMIRLSSGRVVRSQSGVVQGQLYADELADNARERAAKVLDPDLVAVLEAIDGGESYADIRKRLTKTFRAMSPKNLARLTEAALTMAELGGRHAMNEDVDS